MWMSMFNLTSIKIIARIRDKNETDKTEEDKEEVWSYQWQYS